MSLDHDILESLMENQGESKLRTLAQNFLVKNLDPCQISDLKEQFKALDLNSDGLISAEDLRQGCLKVNLPADKVDQVIEAANCGSEKFLNY